MTDASTTGAVERLIERLYRARYAVCNEAAATIAALVAERDAAIQRAEAAADKLDLLLPSRDAIRALRRAAPTEDR